jgi:hypothetical protein
MEQKDKIIIPRKLVDHIFLLDNETTTTCPICYDNYGIQEDGTVLGYHGKFNSGGGYGEKCEHFVCCNCFDKLRVLNLNDNNDGVCCPICREDWSDYLSMLEIGDVICPICEDWRIGLEEEE